MSTATARPLLGALSKGKCPGLRGWVRATLGTCHSDRRPTHLSPGPEGGTRRDGEWLWWGIENGLGAQWVRGRSAAQGSPIILPRD